MQNDQDKLANEVVAHMMQQDASGSVLK